MGTLSASSSFSDVFNQDTPEFLEAITNTVFPGEIIDLNAYRSLKRHRSDKTMHVSSLSQELVLKSSQETMPGSPVILGQAESLLHVSKKSRVSDVREFVQGSSKCASASPLEVESVKENLLLEDDLQAENGGIFCTDPATIEDAECVPVPDYAPHKANPHAERLMQDPTFRSEHTSAAGAEFIEGFYQNSRLHHLSMWKAELKALVVEAQERAENAFALGTECVTDERRTRQDIDDGYAGKVDEDTSPGASMRGNAFQLRSPTKNRIKGKERARNPCSDQKVIMHCDFDCFFASVGILSRPHLKDKPVVVCHSQGGQGGQSSTSEVSSANYKARESGIRAGMSLSQARKLCSSVVTVPYEFEKYKEASLNLYTILMTHADDLQAVSVDEALVDVTSAVRQMPPAKRERYDPAKVFADMLRAEIKKTTGCDISIGISHNIMLARLATRKAKPAGSFHLKLADLQKHISHLCIDDVHGFGRATREKALDRLGSATLGELARKPKSVLCDVFGKTTGVTIYDACRGVNHKQLESDKPRKSVSAEINYGIRFEDQEQARAFMFQLSEEVSRRLVAIGTKGRSLTLKIMKKDPNAPVEAPKFLGHGHCNIFNKQVNLTGGDGRATDDALVIGQYAWKLLKGFEFDPRDLRGIGIQIQRLERADGSGGARALDAGQTTLVFCKKSGRGNEKRRKEEKEPQLLISREEAEKSGVRLTVQAPSSQSDSQSQSQSQPQKTSQESTSSEDATKGQSPILPSHNTQPPAPGIASNLFLPSFSQVDRSAYEALPTQLRTEINNEYSRRSASPALSAVSDTPSLSPPKRRSYTTDKGTPLSRIAQALAPRTKDGATRSAATAGIGKGETGMDGLKRGNIFERCVGQKEERGTKVVVSRIELEKLGIDGKVFYELPTEMQLEQLQSARFEKSFGGGSGVGEKKGKGKLSPKRAGDLNQFTSPKKNGKH